MRSLPAVTQTPLAAPRRRSPKSAANRNDINATETKTIANSIAQNDPTNLMPLNTLILRKWCERASAATERLAHNRQLGARQQMIPDTDDFKTIYRTIAHRSTSATASARCVRSNFAIRT